MFKSFTGGALLAGLLIVSISACRKSSSDSSRNTSIAANKNISGQESGTPHQGQLDNGDLKLRYQARKQTNASTANHIVGSNEQRLEKLLGELNERINLPFDLYISFEDCEEPDAYYDPEKHQVTICYQLIDEYYDLFARAIKDKTKLDDAVRAATAATFLHELGHGLVDAWKIPITGREEDAVDQLSTLVLIETTEDGEQMALDGALTFKLYANLEKGQAKVYWDEHSLDEQRFFDTICLVYGHNKEKYQYLVKNGTLPEERAMYCSEEYERVNRSWQQLLGPYVRKAEQPRPKLKLR